MMKGKVRLGKALTWGELADIYDEHQGYPRARTLPMDSVFAWAKRRTDEFKVMEDGTIRRILKGGGEKRHD